MLDRFNAWYEGTESTVKHFNLEKKNPSICSLKLVSTFAAIRERASAQERLPPISFAFGNLAMYKG